MSEQILRDLWQIKNARAIAVTVYADGDWHPQHILSDRLRGLHGIGWTRSHALIDALIDEGRIEQRRAPDAHHGRGGDELRIAPIEGER